MRRTATQNRQLHALLTQSGLAKHKEALVYNYTNGRTGSSSELNYYEANRLIAYLNQEVAKKRGASASQTQNYEACHRLRRALIAQSYGIGEGVDFIKGWCEKMGVFGIKKKFNNYNAQELKGLLEKFKKVQAHRIACVGERLK